MTRFGFFTSVTTPDFTTGHPSPPTTSSTPSRRSSIRLSGRPCDRSTRRSRRSKPPMSTRSSSRSARPMRRFSAISSSASCHAAKRQSLETDLIVCRCGIAAPRSFSLPTMITGAAHRRSRASSFSSCRITPREPRHPYSPLLSINSYYLPCPSRITKGDTYSASFALCYNAVKSQ